jgi:C4-dicarboxylate-specific signal transduction histidine kinase
MMSITEKLNLLRKVPLFKYTSDNLLQDLANVIGEQHVTANELIVKKGEVGKEMYIIAQGKVKVHDGNKFLAELSTWDVFGELAALFPEMRIASVSAIEDSILLIIDHDTLYSAMSKNISLAQGIIEVLCLRTRNISKLQNQIVQQEKLASLGRLSSGIAHEIKNPLNFVINLSGVSCELIREVIEELRNDNLADLKELLDSLNELMKKIKAHGKRAGEIVKKLLKHSHTEDRKAQVTSIPALIDQALQLALLIFSKKELDFSPQVATQYDPNAVPLEVFSQDLIHVFINIINNAFYAMNEKQKKNKAYIPKLEINLKDSLNEMKIFFKDNGGGISEKEFENVFHPFFTTKPLGEGVGLGLSLSYEIITEQHGGKLEVFSDHKTYAEFVITLPKKTSGE